MEKGKTGKREDNVLGQHVRLTLNGHTVNLSKLSSLSKCARVPKILKEPKVLKSESLYRRYFFFKLQAYHGFLNLLASQKEPVREREPREGQVAS